MSHVAADVQHGLLCCKLYPASCRRIAYSRGLLLSVAPWIFASIFPLGLVYFTEHDADSRQDGAAHMRDATWTTFMHTSHMR